MQRFSISITEDGTLNSYIRLADGNFAGQGRLEVYYNNEWGSICDDYWSDTNSHVVCQHLGYESAVNFYVNVYDVGVPMVRQNIIQSETDLLSKPPALLMYDGMIAIKMMARIIFVIFDT